MARCMRNNTYVLPNDLSVEYPGHACLLGNMLETAGAALSHADCSFEMVRDSWIIIDSSVIIKTHTNARAHSTFILNLFEWKLLINNCFPSSQDAELLDGVQKNNSLYVLGLG
jgi:hypothetical protein